MKKIAILGSTGSIGRQTLEVLEKLGGYQITALTANTNKSLLLEQAKKYGVSFVAVTGIDGKTEVDNGVKISYGKDTLIEACDMADEIVLSVTGISGLPAFEYALKKGKKIYLATKEALVCGGRLARNLIDENKNELVPIDSEISAIYQSLMGYDKANIERILLTCSGGPFRKLSKEALYSVKPEDALKHPNWNMGSKITIDCASLINKGLEIMETRWFFDVDPAKIEVVVHPESIIHSAVEYNDANVIAQLAVHDMRVPIHYAFTAPKRAKNGLERLDLFKVGILSFEKPDIDKFPCLALAYEAVKNDGYLQTVLNSSNEVAVEAFLNKKIGFMDIPKIIENSMRKFTDVKLNDFSDIYRLDIEVRDFVASEYSI